MHIPAPRLKLPGHSESYNPPPEYLPTEEEVSQTVTQSKNSIWLVTYVHDVHRLRSGRRRILKIESRTSCLKSALTFSLSLSLSHPLASLMSVFSPSFLINFVEGMVHYEKCQGTPSLFRSGLSDAWTSTSAPGREK